MFMSFKFKSTSKIRKMLPPDFGLQDIRIMTCNITTLSIRGLHVTVSIRGLYVTVSIRGLYVTVGIRYTQHK